MIWIGWLSGVAVVVLCGENLKIWTGKVDVCSLCVSLHLAFPDCFFFNFCFHFV